MLKITIELLGETRLLPVWGLCIWLYETHFFSIRRIAFNRLFFQWRVREYVSGL